MDRRELLKVMALTFGASIALPESAFAKLGEPLDPSKLDFFTAGQRKLVAELSETIIPKTDTPGAIDAGVPAWVELLVQDCLEENDRKIITAGLAEIETLAEAQSGKPFAELSTEDRIRLLTAMEQAAKKAGDGKAFIRQFKDLVKFTYVNSEVGGTQALEWILVPTKWIPDMKLEPGAKVYV